MAKEKKLYFGILAVVFFIVYIVLAARPIPPETILVNKWLLSLDDLSTSAAETSGVESTAPETASSGAAAVSETPSEFIPFSLGNRFGYVSREGKLLLNTEREKAISLSADHWARYDAAPKELVILHPAMDGEIVLEHPDGYPVFMDRRIFLLSRDQTSLEEIGEDGKALWHYDFEAPLTCMDAAGGYVLAGTLDGMIDLLDSEGKPLFPSYAIGGSRIPVILGCRISSDGTKLAAVSGIDKQRFLFFERYGSSDYRITFHQFLKGEGFRREVQMAFIENDTRVVFEEEAGLGIYDVQLRTALTIPLTGRLLALDESGGEGLLLYVTGTEKNDKLLTLLKLPSTELAAFPFKSGTVFLARRGKDLFLGGGSALTSFTLDRR